MDVRDIIQRRKWIEGEMWARACVLILDGKPVTLQGRALAWRDEAAYYMSLNGAKPTDYNLKQLNLFYLALSVVNTDGDVKLPIKTARWPKGPGVFYENKAKHLGPLGLFYKSTPITRQTVVAIRYYCIKEDKDEFTADPPPAPQDR